MTRAPLSRWPLIAAFLLALLLLVLLVLALAASRTGRSGGELWCIERPGTLWNGAAPLPAGVTPKCPQSGSYREEVRRGEARIEQYRVPGWQPRALIPALKAAGYRQLTDEDINAGNYAAFLDRGGDLLQYVAAREDGSTLIGISGEP